MRTLLALLFAFHFLAASFGQKPRQPEKSLTFFFVSDTHYGKSDLINAANTEIVEAMNSLPGTAYQAGVEGKVAAPAGVVISGDLTEGKDEHWASFVADFGLNGKGKLRFPVFEAFGNHDGPVEGPVRSGIRDRNKKRKNVSRLSTNGLHYAWNWGGYHFVNLNLYPGSVWDPTCEWCQYFKDSFREAQQSLEFLEEDLRKSVGKSQKVVILTFHYGFDDWGFKWWTKAEQDAFYAIIQKYNVKAIFHGHTHTVNAYTWRGIPVFCVGSSQKDSKSGEFMVVRIMGDKMVVAQRTVDAWGKVFALDLAATSPAKKEFPVGFKAHNLVATYLNHEQP